MKKTCSNCKWLLLHELPDYVKGDRRLYLCSHKEVNSHAMTIGQIDFPCQGGRYWELKESEES